MFDVRLERALRIAGMAGDAEPLRRSLERALRERGADAWDGSMLTHDGYPVELAFSTRGTVHWTADPAPPAATPAERLAIAARLAGLDGGAASELIAAAAPPGGAARYGAWIGGTASRSKLYVEVPSDAVVPRELTLPPYELRLLGVDAAGRRLERYYRASEGLDERFRRRLIALVGDICVPHPLLETACRSTCGFSIATSGGDIDAVSFFAFADALFGSDASIRAAVLRLFDAVSADPSTYAALTAPLAAATGSLTHGMLAIVASRGGTELRIGVSPPAVTNIDV